MRYALVDADSRALVLKPIEGASRLATVVDHCSSLLIQTYRRPIREQMLNAGPLLTAFSKLRVMTKAKRALRDG